MKKYKLKLIAGSFTDRRNGSVRYERGAIIETDEPLHLKFKNAFERIHSDEGSPAAPPETFSPPPDVAPTPPPAAASVAAAPEAPRLRRRRGDGSKTRKVVPNKTEEGKFDVMVDGAAVNDKPLTRAEAMALAGKGRRG